MKIDTKKDNFVECPVKVGVCICPLTEDEVTKNECESISFTENEIKVSMGEGKGQKTYEVDYQPFYFGADSSKLKVSTLKEVCHQVGNVILEEAFAGYNSSLFTFGAKATGKSTLLYGYKAEHGVVWHTLKGLFEMAEGYEIETSFRCEISYFEICGNIITDLISKRGNIKSQEGFVKLKVKEDHSNGVYVEKLSRHIVTDMDEAKKLLNKGVKNRNRLAALDPNSKETSHSIFSITFTQARMNDGLPMELVSKINLIDLASKDGYTGYMNGLKNMIEEEDAEGEVKREPLEVLQDVITSLAAHNYGCINPMRSYGSVHPVSHIPYQDSSLTLLMKDALGGNCRTIMMCCLSASQKSLRDNLNTLKYANLARHINNRSTINEDQNVKLIRELKDEIETLKRQPVDKGKDAMRKIQRDQELMNRLTGIWEEKWSIAQKMIQDKMLDVSDLGGGKGLKFETKEPHFVSLGGGRLSVGVSIIPVQKGFTRVGCGGEGYEVDMMVQGNGIASEHCLIEYDGDAVVLHPKHELVSVDGIPITEPTRLPQGAMICIGKNNYFRFNHPQEAAQIREQYKNTRFSIVPDGIYPDVQLAIEQRRKEMQEREVLQAENKRLLAMEQQYVQSLEKLEFEKDQLEHEKTKLQILQQQQQNVANQFDRNVSIQIEELKIHKEELKRLQFAKTKILEKEKDIELAASKLDEERSKKEQEQSNERERILSEQASLDLEEFEALEQTLINKDANGNPLTEKAMALVNDKHNLALMELDILTNDLEYHNQFQSQREEIEREKERLENMEEQHKELERVLSEQIQKLQKDRENELSKIEEESKRLKELEIQQNTAIELIEIERQNLMRAKECEKEKLEKEREEIEEFENERMRLLQKTVDDQEKEKEMIELEKMRLIDLEEEHKRALEELHRDMISQQEKLERERQLELEYIETEQLMLEELEHKQFESARQIEYEAQLIREQVSREKEAEQKKLEVNERYILEIRKQQEIALHQAEEERRKMQIKREEEQRQLREERDLLATREKEYKALAKQLEDEKEKLYSQFQKEKDEEIARMKEEFLHRQSPSPSAHSASKTFLGDIDEQLMLSRSRRSPEGKLQEIEDERLRLNELKRQAAEKAELEWTEKKKEEEKRELEEKEIKVKKEELMQLKLEQEMKAETERRMLQEETEKMKKHEDLLKQRESELAELHKERARREELEQLLERNKLKQNMLDQSLNQEKEKFNNLEQSFVEERSRRLEIEQRLQLEESRNRTLESDKVDKKGQDSRSVGNGVSSNSNGTLKKKTPSYNLSLRSGQSSGNSEETNLLHHIMALGHVVDHCPEIKINRYTCRGYLQKMGKSRLKISWKRRWFIFDRKKRALCYYQDERKTKAKGIIYFQSIQEVYVDSTLKRSPNPKTTFCIRTPMRPYIVTAPSAIAMSIWIDVICTGKEGVFLSMG